MKKVQSTEEKICEAALEVFLEKGKEGARMQEIADRAGINKALLHYYFRTKERLFQHVFRIHARRFFGYIFDAVIDTRNFQEFVGRFIDHYISRMATHPLLVRFVLWDIEDGAKILGDVIHSSLSERGYTDNPVLQKINQAIQKKEIREVDPVHFLISLIGLCLMPFLAHPLLEQVFDGLTIFSPEFLETRKKEVFSLIWQGIKPE